MRITFILPQFDRTGGVRVVAVYADRLQRRGHPVTVVAGREPRPHWKDVVRGLLKGEGWPKRHDRDTSHFANPAVTLRQLDHGGPIHAAEVPDGDVVIATWWETAEWVARFPASKGVHVHFIQHYEVYGGDPKRVGAVYDSPIPKIVIAEWLADRMRRHGQPPVALIPNSVDTDKFFAPPRGKQPVPTVGTMYTPFPGKGADIAIRAYELAAARVPGLRLVSCGNLPVVPRVIPLPAGAEFTLKAKDDQLRAIYSQCDAWLFASREDGEGFGLPILEAMACRTPVIGTPSGAGPDLIRKGGGMLVPFDDPQAMADGIVSVCSMSDAQWRILSDAALVTATGFTWEDATNAFERVLADLVARRGAAR